MKKYEFNGETFQLDDSKGCYIEVTYKGLVGYVGVNLKDGTSSKQYSWTAPGIGSGVTKDGVAGGVPATGGLDGNLQALCRALIAKHGEAEAHKAFKPEEACVALHEFMEKLPA